MLTLYSNNTLSFDRRHIGSVSQEKEGTVFYASTGERHLFPRITLGSPDHHGWRVLEAKLREVGVIS